jgi:hypothetical protein
VKKIGTWDGYSDSISSSLQFSEDSRWIIRNQNLELGLGEFMDEASFV